MSDLDPHSRDLVIRTILGEAANEPDDGMAAVAAVIRNRALSGRYGDSIPGVVLARNQFEPWSTPQGRQRMLSYAPDSEPYKRAAAATDAVFQGGNDPTQGATHFYSPTAQAQLGRQPPSWAKGEPLAIGRHNFYAPEGRVAVKGPQEVTDADVLARFQQTSQPQEVTDPDVLARFSGGQQQKPPVAAPPTPQDKGVVDAVAGGIARGATFNFHDELRGLAEAGGTGAREAAGLWPIIKGAALYFGGNPEAISKYEAAQGRASQEAKTAEQQHPIASTVGQIGGAVMLPIGIGAQAATLPGRMAGGAATGALFGGVSGIGEGEGVADRAARGLTGAAIGTAAGAVLPAAIEGVTRGVRAAGQPIANTVRGVTNVDDEAARRVTAALQRDVNADPQAVSRLNPQEFAAQVQNNGPARIIDIGGDTTRALARSAANTSPEARGVLNRTINDRFEGQAGRITGWLERTFHYPNAQAQQEALEQTARSVNRANYNRAYREGQGGIWSPELERLAGSDAVVAAMQKAASNAKDEAIVGGYGAMNPRITFTQDGRIQFNRGPNGVPTYPDLQYWDLVRRELGDAARRAGHGTSEARRLNNFATSLNNELDNLVPSYQTARRGAAAFFGAENALEAGQNFVMTNVAPREARQALARMSDTERRLFQDGFVSRFVETLNKVGDRRNVLNQVASNPQAREKLQIALGPQRANELEAGLRAEGIMDIARGAVQGNSTTARQLVELGLAGGAYGAGTGFDIMNPNPSALVSAALVWGVARGKGRVNENVARRVADMLASNNPQVVLQGARVIARNGQMLNSLRAFDQRLARVGGQQSAIGSPAVGSVGVSRAQDNEPAVPRPPGQ